MNRNCPNCSNNSIALKELLFGDCRCGVCLAVIGVHRIASAVSSFFIFAIAIVTTLIVLIELDLYAALLWFTLPVGALSYLKVRFCPLVTRSDSPGPGEPDSASHRTG